MSQNQAAPAQFSLLPKIINGGVAGVVGVTCIFPIDLVKTRLQNQPIGPNGERMYKNMFDCFKQTYRAEGYFGMYRGSAVNILLVSPEKAIKLAANDFFRFHLTTKDGELPLTSQMIAGGLAGLFQIIVTTPMELLKIKMQDQGRAIASAKAMGKTVQRVSAIQHTTQLIREKGIFGLYRGIIPTAYRDVIFSVIYFPLFAWINGLAPRRNDGEAVFWGSFLGGLGSASISGWLVTPFDVVKTRLQAGNVKYNGFIDCFTRTLRHEGITALFKGGLCRVMVLSPLYAIAQMVYYFGVGEFLVGR